MVRRLAIVLLGAVGCGEHALDAVTGLSCLEQPAQAACARASWPNELSSANSDPWLEAHGDALLEMRPSVLVLDFHNPLSPSEMEPIVQRQFAALAEGSRYHGYADPEAPAFLSYQMSAMIDLRDDPPAPAWAFSSSSRVPLDAQGSFDIAALFAEPYTSLIGRADPDRPGRVLDLCEQFARGMINELWLAVGDTAPGREPPPMVECKAHRDDAGGLGDGGVVPTSHAAVCASLPDCGVTVRIAHLSPLRGPGCDLLVRGWAVSGSLAAIPYLRANASRFFNADLDERYGAPVPNLLSLCPQGPTPCLSYPTPTSLQSVLAGGPQFRLEGFGLGCGSPELPPNAAFVWDWESPVEVQTRCEHYGLRDGADGQDLPSSYSFEKVSQLGDRDCGGGWQIYWRQNIPGLGNQAVASDGTPMKNWWPFLFY
jgi:hypothetical protein